ncbi:MAG: DUF4956 domain-containing protein [Lachnospiraceae bacterium]|nr:DUF4956 domain-containing protein [Lachnospiraceae bacterium]MDE7309098.1 DUF4956 domain-containing protein [Lachnospiraceae bacterium]
MFTTIFEAADSTSTANAGIGLETADILISLGVALALGMFLSLVYIFSDAKKKYSQHFAFTLVILPVCVAAVIMLIGSDIAKAISLGGVFALVRFRSVPGNSKDIVNVFFAMATGLACGVGYILFAVVFCVSIGAVYFLLNRFGYAVKKTQTKQLTITIPENLNYQGAFDDLFEEYTKSAMLEKVKTTNLGTLYELTYAVELKEDVNEKLLIDSLRCRNGNLNISLGIREEDSSMIL